MGEDVDIEGIREAPPPKDQIGADRYWDHVTQTLRSTLAIERALGKNRGQKPDDAKETPATADNLAYEQIHSGSQRDPITVTKRRLSVITSVASRIGFRITSRDSQSLTSNSAAQRIPTSGDASRASHGRPADPSRRDDD